ncbi:MAG TPA: alpha/beta hydrolase, partial [Anseongella sp.]|nr:alpha/beta hydrolase [Anseongella sp.]
FVLFSMPLIRAFRISRGLKRELREAFGKSGEGAGPACRKPFSFWKMFLGPLKKKTAYQSLVYYSDPGLSLSLDFYPAGESGPRPCVLVIHGGSWSSGDSRQLPELNSRLAQAGYHVAAVNYRLAPAYQSPSPVEDLRNALVYLRRQAPELQIDGGNFVLLGRSAGGQIALLAAYTLADPGIKGVIGFYAPADMVWGYSAPANPPPSAAVRCRHKNQYFGKGLP